MATDFAVQFFFYPVLLGVLVLCVLAWRLKPIENGLGLAGLGIRRIVHGYIGVILAALVFACIQTYIIGIEKVELGHIKQEELASWVPPWGIYMFILTVPFILLVVSFIGFPLLIVFSKLRLNSIFGVMVISLVFPVGLTAFTYINPYNIWCTTHLAACSFQSFYTSLWPSILVGLSFGIFARLPMWREVQASET